ncbi:AraC-type DNA-binding protein [Pseudarcicella hirudinis]|uniref:AraC-type DNA-binding protein n=2 Tax=Pseudarcicella hirudinis TaxID=1079859 RepID=A0A1I5LYL9_9BACT|nr:helix-turn-helix domain-containing protein [Pseudarcicella hirudinis]SFP02257.1 AraC-type DNA-binding protein [Pseudarcicella hirudinis]
MNTDHSIQFRTISDMVTIFGENLKTEGLHVFVKDEIVEEIPITYPFRSDHFSIMLILSGEMTVKLNLINYTLKANTILAIPPNTVRQFVDCSEHMNLFGVSFTSDYAMSSGIHRGNMDSFDFFASKIVPTIELTEEESGVIQNAFRLLYDKNSNAGPNHPYNEEIVLHTFCILLFEIGAIFFKYTAHIKTKLTRKEELSGKFLKLLNDHFKEQRSVQYYAELLFVTPKHLSQSIKDTMGKTAGEMIDEMVITEARILLFNASLSIAQVAEMLYFSDQFFFSKFFKKITGQSPSEFRKTCEQ